MKLVLVSIFEKQAPVLIRPVFSFEQTFRRFTACNYDTSQSQYPIETKVFRQHTKDLAICDQIQIIKKEKLPFFFFLTTKNNYHMQLNLWPTLKSFLTRVKVTCQLHLQGEAENKKQRPNSSHQSIIWTPIQSPFLRKGKPYLRWVNKDLSDQTSYC